MAETIEVKLTATELMSAALIGVMRHVSSLNKGRQDAHGLETEGWTEHIEGACGEMALSKAMNAYYPGTINTFKKADVGDKIQVKTRSNHEWDLLVRKNDDISHVYVLVTGKAPHYVVRGWMGGSEAKQEQWLQTYGGRPPAYFVPQEFLYGIESLRLGF